MSVNFIESSDIRFTVTRKVLSMARDFLSESALEIAEVSVIAKLKFFIGDRVELLIDSFRNTNYTVSQGFSVLSDEILVPLFLFRAAPSNVLSSETFTSKLRDIWQQACSSKSSLRLSNYLFLWATAGFDMSVPSVQAKRELSWLNVNAVLPNVPFFLRKIRSYPFDADYLRFCLQTELAVEKFKHLDPLDSRGEFCNYRFGFFLMDSSGCLVPYLDGDPILESSTVAGVWCSGVGEASINTWLALFRYAFFQGRVDAHRRVFCTAPVLAVHDRPSNRVSFYSIHCDTKEGVVKKQPAVFTRERLTGSRVCLHFSPLESGYTYTDVLEFHMLAGCGSLKAFSGPARTTSSAFTLRLEPLNAANNSALRADLFKFADAVAALATDLGCKISSSSSIKLPVPKSMTIKIGQLAQSRTAAQPTQSVLVKATPPSSQKSQASKKRSVKFDLSPKTSTVTCEVPEVSLLVEEGVCTDSPRSPRAPVSTDAMPRNPPLISVPIRPFRPPLLNYHPQRIPRPRLFPAFSTPQRYVYDPTRYYSPPVMPSCYRPPAPPQRPGPVPPTPTDLTAPATVCEQSAGAGLQECSSSGSEHSREDFARLEMLIEKLLTWHKDLENSRTLNTSASTAMTASVGTNTTNLWPPIASITSAEFMSPRGGNEEGSHTSVAVNTSLHWPTLSSIGLLPESPRRCESTATQCSQAFDSPATSDEIFENGAGNNKKTGVSDHPPSKTATPVIRDSRRHSEECSNSQSSLAPFPILSEGQFWSAASTAAQASVPITSLSTQCSPDTGILMDSSHDSSTNRPLAENSTAASSYSAQLKSSCHSTDSQYRNREEEGEPSCTTLLAELQHVLTAQRPAPTSGGATADVSQQAALRKTHSEPTFAATPLTSAAVQPNFMDHPTLDADYEQELAKQRRLCEEAAVLLLSQLDSSSHLSTPDDSPLKMLLNTEDSQSFAQNRSIASRSKSNYSNTDESAILAGLVKKYLSPTLIQKLTCGDHFTTLSACTHSSFSTSEVHFGLPDVSMATRRYLEHHNLLGDRRGERDYRGGDGRVQMASTPAFSEVAPAAEFSSSISTLVPAVTEYGQNPTSRYETETSLEPWSALRSSELFSRQPPCASDKPEEGSAEYVLGPSYDHALSQTCEDCLTSPLSNAALDESCSRILDLEHLRTLPKLL